MRVFAPVVLGTVSGGEDTGPYISPGAVVERLLLYVPTRRSCVCGNFAQIIPDTKGYLHWGIYRGEE